MFLGAVKGRKHIVLTPDPGRKWMLGEPETLPHHYPLPAASLP